MSATIDHLESHFRVRALQSFADARGISVPAGATGVIRMMNFDTKVMEFTIDWERDDRDRQLERLTFSLNATSGPRNNHMREYFEKIEFVAPPGKPKPATPEPPPEPEPERKRRPDEPLERFEGRQPQQELLLHDLTVACDCDPGFHRSLIPSGHYTTSGCLRCGAVTVTRQVGDDGRFTGNAWTAYWAIPIPQAQVDWLANFPRASINYSGAPWRWPMSASLVRYPHLLYPAHARADDIAELNSLEARLRAEQAKLSRADALGSTCGDIPPPPEALDDAFRGYAAIQRCINLRPDADLNTLRAHAQLLSPACELAADLLIRRRDALGTMMNWLRSSDDDTFGAGIAMLRDARALFSGPDDPRLAPDLLAILNALPLGPLRDVPDRVESWFRFEAILVAIADLGIRTDAMRDGLNDLRGRLATRDTTVANAIRIVINELNGIDNRPPEHR